MDRRFVARILTFLLLVGIIFPARQAGAWYCEGKRCGITYWTCCCQDPAPYHDGRCEESSATSLVEATGFGNCPSDCDCVMISNAPDAEGAFLPSALSAPDPLLAVLTAPTTVGTQSLVAKTAPQQLEARGPPGRIALGTPSLRAPPTA